MTLPEVLRGKILVAGAGVSGIGTATLLHNLGADFLLVDDSAGALERAANVPTAVLDPALLDHADLVVTSPGWRPDAEFLVAAQQRGIPVIGDVELAYRLDRAEVFGPRRTWMVVTGTNGKTTTTAMLASMMQAGGFKAQAVGNIGVSVADALTASRVDVLVAELSSFQLHWSEQLTPDVGVLLNLADDHIDWHGSFQAYAEAKAKVLRAPISIAGKDDPEVWRFAHASTVGFGLASPDAGELGIADGALVSCAFGDEHVFLAPAEGIQPAGPAGLYDALAAAAAARAMGVEAAAIASALSEFQVAGHRGQQVAGSALRAIDNSKATNPHAADAALAGFSRLVWIAGGQLKGASVDELIRTHAHRLKAAALLGQDRRIIADALARLAPHVQVMLSDSDDPDVAMREVTRWAVKQAGSDDAIVLAPAAASLDMYTGMAQRGDLFARYIVEAQGESAAT
ncbi:UDP-N-acetylmuramoyl-L-alanine--D-glutamate ligase [Corynebacterium gerontici]|uniref:UDP-N-acetylmuramoylalanine--D-glutamate ligase n=1 Tax=Corynebacterium gerontici TaxID=2079234 RepID=A0A3G6J1E7_9CORY|nr:UDP-N-acetylmuramoyl-L-alanine--D-glutamate ligase [Corynebacterium gerontici]AZA11769.1 UDP-N-acetylmuramoylalanine--D-glutamate ligase [Corynebacterium gerontici]